MPNLPKPRLRRTDRSVTLAPAAPQTPDKPDVDIVQGAGLRWLNIERPTQVEWAWLRENFDFHLLDLEDVGKIITEKKIAIGAIDHHTLQVEAPQEVADVVRAALKVIPAERLILTSDCGMGREGMSRRHAFYKMVSLVQGTNIVKKELGLPVTESMAADPALSLLRIKK